MNNHKTVLIPYTNTETTLNCDFLLQTAKQLSKKNYPVHLIFKYFSIITWLLEILKRTNIVEQLKENFQTDFHQYSNFSVHFLSFFPPAITEKHEIISRINEILLGFWLKINFLSPIIFWNFHYDNLRVLKFISNKNSIKVFDIVDFFSSLNPQFNKIIEEKMKLTISNSDLIFVNSLSLYAKYKDLGKKITIVPQGFDLDTFQQKATTKKIDKQLEKFSHSKNPKIGFIGNLTFRMNFKLIEDICYKFPNIQFFFSDTYLRWDSEDSVINTIQAIKKLKQIKNIYWIPQIPRVEVKQWLNIFDICIIPYDISYEFNRYCYPMKLFEYFYMGKPVISTSIEELKRFPKYVKIGNTAEEWERHIKSLLAKPWPERYKQEQRELAIENSWQNKINQILSHINEYEKEQKRRKYLHRHSNHPRS